MPKIQKSNNNSKYIRINLIYDRLSNTTNGVTIKELADELDVSTKTIQRDLYDVLVDFGAVKDGRYWKIDKKQENDHLKSSERLILGILDNMAKGLGKPFYSKAHSLLSQMSQQLEHPVFTHFNSETIDQESFDTFELIEQSIKHKEEIVFNYQNWDFQVKPLKLAFFDGFWYLLAFDSNRKDKFKKFHLNSIKNLNQTKISFEVTQIVEERLKYANSIWFNLDEPFSVRLFIYKDARKYFERKPLPSQMIMGEDNDGSIELEVKITHEREILSLIFDFMPYIKVLEPQWLADSVKKRVQNYLQEL
jgi:predicted DNA-binding transcriptional regulator YafY